MSISQCFFPEIMKDHISNICRCFSSIFPFPPRQAAGLLVVNRRDIKQQQRRPCCSWSQLIWLLTNLDFLSHYPPQWLADVAHILSTICNYFSFLSIDSALCAQIMPIKPATGRKQTCLYQIRNILPFLRMPLARNSIWRRWAWECRPHSLVWIERFLSIVPSHWNCSQRVREMGEKSVWSFLWA